ncbi:MAG TPA: FtsX-like permease family protein [Rectinemataceae bacterium]|nr:FtsX-like permease family protein [Rectinemataceae bacterium]
MLLKMALLSALKRPKRAILIMLAVALSVFVMEFVSGWVEGMKIRMQQKIVEESAHLIIERKARLDALDPLEPKNYIEDAKTLAARIAADPRVSRVEELSSFGALVLAGDRNLPLQMYAVEEGTSYFSQIGRGARTGGFPFKGAGIAISQKALDLIGAGGARSLIVLVEDSSGAPQYRELPVACVFQTDDSQFDSSTAFMDRATAADLLGTKGAAELWVKLARPDDAPAVAASLGPLLSPVDCVARTWETLQGSLLVLIKFMNLFMLVVNIFVLVVAATVITNAILMNVFEKQREYGTLRAIGMKRRQQGALVLLEGAGQGVAGALIGAVLALPLILYLKHHGLPIGEASHVIGAGDVMYFGMNALSTLRNVCFGALIAVVGSLYAALAGTRGSVVDALKNS